MKRAAAGAAAALAATLLLCLAMVPVRDHVGIAIPALVLVVPVVLGVTVGGFGAGAVSVAAGFLAYDWAFIPPYGTLSVGAASNWTALGVYAVVMLLVARVVSGMHAARDEAARRGGELRRLFELSDLLVADRSLDALLPAITSALADALGAGQVALLLPATGGGEGLEVAATAGRPLDAAQVEAVAPGGRQLRGAPPFERGGLLVLALAAAGRPVGLLAVSAGPARRHDRDALLLFANHAALAVERAQLREQALDARLADAIAGLARTLVAAVSHDLRTPLASIKASSSTLADAGVTLAPEDRAQLARLIDTQADRLAGLVRDLLDMSRIQGGVLSPRAAVEALGPLVDRVLADMGDALAGHAVQRRLPAHLPPVDIDVVLVARVLTNLLDNAARHSPPGAPIAVSARPLGAMVELSVTDRGAGVPDARRNELFRLFARRPGDTGAGLGLTIARTFVEAHGGRIWVEDPEGGGARFCFTLPVAALPAGEEPAGEVTGAGAPGAGEVAAGAAPRR